MHVDHKPKHSIFTPACPVHANASGRKRATVSTAAYLKGCPIPTQKHLKYRYDLATTQNAVVVKVCLNGCTSEHTCGCQLYGVGKSEQTLQKQHMEVLHKQGGARQGPLSTRFLSWLAEQPFSVRHYMVDLQRGHCNCPDFAFHRLACKHIFSAMEHTRTQWACKHTSHCPPHCAHTLACS
jgi:hypothetical protein